jgi:COP9 signalosome complex subunit 2
LKIPVSEVQDILGFLIVDKKVNGKINQQDGTVEIEDSTDSERLRAMQEWTSAIESLYRTLFSEGEGFKMPEVQQIGDGDNHLHMALASGAGRGGPMWGGLKPNKKGGKKMGLVFP